MTRSLTYLPITHPHTLSTNRLEHTLANSHSIDDEVADNRSATPDSERTHDDRPPSHARYTPTSDEYDPASPSEDSASSKSTSPEYNELISPTIRSPSASSENDDIAQTLSPNHEWPENQHTTPGADSYSGSPSPTTLLLTTRLPAIVVVDHQHHHQRARTTTSISAKQSAHGSTARHSPTSPCSPPHFCSYDMWGPVFFEGPRSALRFSDCVFFLSPLPPTSLLFLVLCISGVTYSLPLRLLCMIRFIPITSARCLLSSPSTTLTISPYLGGYHPQLALLAALAHCIHFLRRRWPSWPFCIYIPITRLCRSGLFFHCCFMEC
ncbi:hypothetical protein BDN70DRAFT_286392 [Pholiota conissans]|uniref:Uncharacterized protein n=1 Tax=Pholiota conissans TaxID=109636 RepID=A0A9P6CPR0_9AGAR|nr:hypothetical protein BDN70DRAFT_286392 [Pholiota conissans]